MTPNFEGQREMHIVLLFFFFPLTSSYTLKSLGSAFADNIKKATHWILLLYQTQFCNLLIQKQKVNSLTYKF